VSLVCGSRAEREKACPDTAAAAAARGSALRGREYRRADTPADRLVVVVKPL